MTPPQLSPVSRARLKKIVYTGDNGRDVIARHSRQGAGRKRGRNREKAELEQWEAVRGLHISTVEDHKKLAGEAATMAQFEALTAAADTHISDARGGSREESEIPTGEGVGL